MGTAAGLDTAPDAPVLGVGRSVSGLRWEERPADERTSAALAQRFALPEVVARAMAARGVDLDQAETYLSPSLKAQLPDPGDLLDMAPAIERIAREIRDGQPVGVFGDYDVDGATASALLVRFIRAAGGAAEIYIPDRLKEGYGPNIDGLKALQARGARVVVTVDCGITAFEPLAAARQAGLDVVVVDHHVAEPRLPDAAAVINPNRLDETSPHRQLAAVGVAFLLVVGLNRELRQAGHYGQRPEPDLLQWLDMVALGTVCDVVPLTGVNRALVTQGLKVMAARRNVGLTALCDVAGITEPPAAYHAGYVLGPRVNAGGRVGRAGAGARLLSTEDPAEARRIAEELDRYNAERRAIEARCLDEALEQAEAGGAGETLVYVAAEGWHPGVIGIVAGRLKDRYNRPACVVALEAGLGKGSARSVSGIDLGAAVIAARQSGLLVAGGGHKMAAGFTVEAGRQEAFLAFLEERMQQAAGAEGIVPRLSLDGVVQAGAASLDLVLSLQRLAPFGSGNSEPRFALPRVRVHQAQVVGSDHVRCFLSGEGGGRLKAIAFRCAQTPLGRLLLAENNGMTINVAGRLKIDRWQGREQVQFTIEDAASDQS